MKNWYVRIPAGQEEHFKWLCLHFKITSPPHPVICCIKIANILSLSPFWEYPSQSLYLCILCFIYSLFSRYTFPIKILDS